MLFQSLFGRSSIAFIVVYKQCTGLLFQFIQLRSLRLRHRLNLLGQVLGGDVDSIGGIAVTERVNRDFPLARAVRAFRQLRAERVGQAELNAHGLVHPVVSCEFRTVGGERGGIAFISAVILPDNGLHMAAEVAVILGVSLGVIKINTQHFTEVAGIRLRFRLDVLVCGFKLSILDAGAGTGLARTEAERVALLRNFLQAVGVLVYCGNCRVRLQIFFTVTALKRCAVLGNSVLAAEICKIGRLYLDRNILDAGDVVGSHVDCGLVVSTAVCIDKVVAVRPRNRMVVICFAVLGAVDNNALLEAAAMQTVVGRCAGNRIERALIVLLNSSTVF